MCLNTSLINNVFFVRMNQYSQSLRHILTKSDYRFRIHFNYNAFTSLFVIFRQIFESIALEVMSKFWLFLCRLPLCLNLFELRPCSTFWLDFFCKCLPLRQTSLFCTWTPLCFIFLFWSPTQQKSKGRYSNTDEVQHEARENTRRKLFLIHRYRCQGVQIVIKMPSNTATCFWLVGGDFPAYQSHLRN